jgi:predicted Zn-ribbon and HTH transcriptional regulator
VCIDLTTSDTSSSTLAEQSTKDQLATAASNLLALSKRVQNEDEDKIQLEEQCQHLRKKLKLAERRLSKTEQILEETSHLEAGLRKALTAQVLTVQGRHCNHCGDEFDLENDALCPWISDQCGAVSRTYPVTQLSVRR